MSYTSKVRSVNGLAGTVSLTTSNVGEGTNLYYTDARFDTRFGTKSSTDLANSSNIPLKNAANAFSTGQNISGASATSIALFTFATGDAQARFAIQNDGALTWGDGTAARDTSLYRTSANNLRTDDNLSVGLALSVVGNTTISGGSLAFNNATANIINFGTNGAGAPTFTTRSNGTKVILYPNVNATNADYAFGIEGGAMWSGVPTTALRFKWYGGTTEWMRLGNGGASGNLAIGGGFDAATKLEVQDSTGASQIAFGNAADRAFLGANGSNGTMLSWFAANNGTSWVAKSTVATGYRQLNSSHQWFINSGLVAGTTFTPSDVMILSTTGLGVGMTPAAKLDAAGTIRATNATAPASGAGFELYYSAGNGSLTAYDRTGGTYQTANVGGSTVNIKANGTTKLLVDPSYVESSQCFRVTGSGAAPSGEGLELAFAGGVGYFQAYNRSLSQYRPIDFAASTITFSPSGTTIVTADANGFTTSRAENKAVTVNTANTLTVDITHNRIISNPTVAGAVTITLPAAPVTGREIVVKDGKGDAATNNITIDGNGKNIDGASNLIIDKNYAAYTLVYNGTQWNII